jgi:hypothetical protein
VRLVIGMTDHPKNTRGITMTEYLITIPGDEAVWDARSGDDNRTVGRAHADFVAALIARGDRVTAGGELTALSHAKVVRRTRDGFLVTDGPYAEAREQIGGFYLVQTDDLEGLLEIVGTLVQVEPVVEVRPVLGPTSGMPG